MRSWRIYVASSWRNERQPEVVSSLRADGHRVYDFRNPSTSGVTPFHSAPRGGFHWSEIDPKWKRWTAHEYVRALNHPLAEAGFRSDLTAMCWADAFVLVQPCGRSAHLEMGWACGMGKTTIVLLEQIEPELMIKLCDHVCETLNEVRALLQSLAVHPPEPKPEPKPPPPPPNETTTRGEPPEAKRRR